MYYFFKLIKIIFNLFFLFITIQGYAQSSNNIINWAAFMQEQRLNWDSISDNYYTGILLGN